LARKPNKRDRELRRWREAREARTTIPAHAGTEPRRPLSEFEDHYEITRTGLVWSRRLKRFIKHKYEPMTNHTYIAITVDGVRSTRGVWASVIASWLSAPERQAILGQLPTDVHGKLDKLRTERARIATIAKAVRLPSDAIVALFLAAPSQSGAAAPA